MLHFISKNAPLQDRSAQLPDSNMLKTFSFSLQLHYCLHFFPSTNFASTARLSLLLSTLVFNWRFLFTNLHFLRLYHQPILYINLTFLGSDLRESFLYLLQSLLIFRFFLLCFLSPLSLRSLNQIRLPICQKHAYFLYNCKPTTYIFACSNYIPHRDSIPILGIITKRIK